MVVILLKRGDVNVRVNISVSFEKSSVSRRLISKSMSPKQEFPRVVVMLTMQVEKALLFQSRMLSSE